MNVHHASVPRRVLVACVAVVLVSCGGSDDQAGDGDDGAADTMPPTSDASVPSAAGTDASAALTARCDRITSALSSVPFPASPAGIPAWAELWREAVTSNRLPDEQAGEVPGLSATTDTALMEVDEAVAEAERGDADAAMASAERADSYLLHTAGMSIVAGAECLGVDPARIAEAALNVPVVGAWQLGHGFDSVWASKLHDPEVVRIDPSTGRVIATISVSSKPFKLQPADGRMWVRTADAYEAIDPATNTVGTTLAKSAVGPSADRSWAVDTALWICDGSTLHRYDPTTVDHVTSIDLDITCGQVHATNDLVTAWTYNEEDAESGTSTAVFVDPSTNGVVARVDLPVDVNVPVVFDDRVFFPGWGGATAVVVDRATWTVASTPDLGRPTAGSQPAFDGVEMYVPTYPGEEVLVVDPTTYEVVDTIHPFEANSVSAGDRGVWVASRVFGYLQRFDRAP